MTRITPGFCQRRGYVLAALYPNVLAKSRMLKPQIPLVGMDNILLRDEIELEKPLLGEDQNDAQLF